MKAGELRIGNLVYQNLTDMVESYQKVTVINHYNNSIATEELNEHQIRLGDRYLFVGIPLTTEWLERAGFELRFNTDKRMEFSKEGFNMLADYGNQRIVIEKLPNETDCVYLECGYYQNTIDITYVHQLQNLYFALTGEELTFKPQTT